MKKTKKSLRDLLEKKQNERSELMNRETIANKLVLLRASSKMTQDDVKMKSGLTPTQIVDLEKGRTNYTIDSLLAYLKAIDKNLDIT